MCSCKLTPDLSLNPRPNPYSLTMAAPKYDLEKMCVVDVENQIDSIVASLGKDAILKELTNMLWKKQDELIAMEEAKEPVEKLATIDTQINKLEQLISRLVEADKCPPFCHNPYCECRN